MVWFLANRFAQDSSWLLVILDKFSEYFLLPAIVIFFVSLFTKKVRIILLALVPLLITAFFYVPIIYPVSAPALLKDDQRFRVVTFNIWNHNSDIKQIVEVIKKTQADVVALQEITEDQRLKVQAGLQDEYSFNHISTEIFGGTTALFSQYPLENIKEIDI